MLVSEAVVLVDGAVNCAAAEVNQDSGQELPIARHGLSPNAKAKQSSMQTIDVNNDGVIDEDEAQAAAISSVELRSSLSYARMVTFGALGLVLLSWLGNAGLTSAVVILAKDTYVKGDTTMSNAKGEVVGTRVATHNLPLYVAPVLPDDELFSVETLRVTLPDIEFDVDAVYSYHISSVKKVNSTVVVFYAVGGEQVRVVNGISSVRLSDDGVDIPACSANVTCAAFEVDSSALAAKYIAEADALLAPFVAARRRLGDDSKVEAIRSTCDAAEDQAKKAKEAAKEARDAARFNEKVLTRAFPYIAEFLDKCPCRTASECSAAERTYCEAPPVSPFSTILTALTGTDGEGGIATDIKTFNTAAMTALTGTDGEGGIATDIGLAKDAAVSALTALTGVGGIATNVALAKVAAETVKMKVLYDLIDKTYSQSLVSKLIRIEDKIGNL